jgi:hypothetical protein
MSVIKRIREIDIFGLFLFLVSHKLVFASLKNGISDPTVMDIF